MTKLMTIRTFLLLLKWQFSPIHTGKCCSCVHCVYCHARNISIRTSGIFRKSWRDATVSRRVTCVWCFGPDTGNTVICHINETCLLEYTYIEWVMRSCFVRDVPKTEIRDKVLIGLKLNLRERWTKLKN